MTTPWSLTTCSLYLLLAISAAVTCTAFHQPLPFRHTIHTVTTTPYCTLWNHDARMLPHSPHQQIEPRGSSNTRLQLFPAQVIITEVSAATSAVAALSSDLLLAASNSPEPIHTLFSVATFLPQPFWLLIILFPEQKFTQKIMGGLEVPVLCSLIHLLIVLASLGEQEGTAPLTEFNNVFDPAGDPQRAFLGMVSSYPNFVAEEWSHVLTWDLFVGRWIWLDALEKGIAAAIPTRIGVLFCNLIGPPGFLIYWLSSQVLMSRRGGQEKETAAK